MMDEQNELCLARESPYQSGECRFFLDIEGPAKNIVKQANPKKNNMLTAKENLCKLQCLHCSERSNSPRLHLSIECNS
jgi:hypothetical protein